MDQTKEPEHMYRTHGVCSRAILYDIDDEQKVRNVSFIGGCNGNLKGIGQLIEGMDAQWVIDRLAGTRCGGKATSCPDQLAKALKATLGEA